ncbi:IS5 family transposase [Streptomyces griseoaurantiacus]|uniref:IS5 family transposase n=1 Tax=Streptomyces griseoaurantiacus TaxID=68213 RepID=UPI002E36D358|nr:IS5 family transposase [Streptomyces jietaisiensis]
MGRGDLTNREWSLLEPHLPPLGGRDGRWNDHRTVINGIVFRIRTGVPWRDLPERYGSWKTVYERHRRWSADGTWDRIPHAVQADADLAGGSTGRWPGSTRRRAGPISKRPVPARPSRGSRKKDDAPAPPARRGTRTIPGGLTCKIHLAGEGGCRPMALLLTPGQWGDAPQMIEVLDRIRVLRPFGGRPRTRPEHISGGKAYSSRRNRRYLRRRHIRHTIPEPKDQRANRQRRGRADGRPAGSDRDRYRRRNEVERTIIRLKNSRAVATRYDKRAYVFHGTITAAAIRLRLRQ